MFVLHGGGFITKGGRDLVLDLSAPFLTSSRPLFGMKVVRIPLFTLPGKEIKLGVPLCSEVIFLKRGVNKGDNGAKLWEIYPFHQPTPRQL